MYTWTTELSGVTQLPVSEFESARAGAESSVMNIAALNARFIDGILVSQKIGLPMGSFLRDLRMQPVGRLLMAGLSM
jgi:hypothetical protein